MKISSKIFGLVLITLSVVIAACSFEKTVQVGTHKVVVSRHGYQRSLHFEEKAGIPTFEYSGVGKTGDALKVSIVGDKVKVNGKDGLLKPGDFVLITDDGVLVNKLDYGDSERYLQANALNTSTATN